MANQYLLLMKMLFTAHTHAHTDTKTVRVILFSAALNASAVKELAAALELEQKKENKHEKEFMVVLLQDLTKGYLQRQQTGIGFQSACV